MKKEIKKLGLVAFIILLVTISLMIFNFFITLKFFKKIDNNVSSIETQLINLELINENQE
jgi:hypothetical protein